MDLISTIIVYGFLEIQSKNVAVDDKLTKMYSKSNKNALSSVESRLLGDEF